MKKYLIKGALALFGGTLVLSCAEKESEYVPVAQQKVKAFEDVFKEVYGDNIDPYQDWGFSQGKTNAEELPVVDVVDLSGDVAFTRAAAFGNFGALMAFAGTRAEGKIDPATYVGAYCDGNMWTHEGFQAPDPLTAGQKLRVQYYFQMNEITNPYQPDYGPLNFFMQQVYDGGDDPITKYKSGDYSPEVYYDAGGNRITSGDHMDHLTAGPNHLHINNFNNSTCGWYENVANWNQTDVNDESQQHRDQIELMLNTPTSCFGYANSNDTEIYDDQWTLVAGSVIDDFCENVDATGYASFLAAHSGVVDAKVVDRWNRSFIGFDFKLMPNPDPIKRENGVIVTAKYGDADGSQWGYAYNGTSVVNYSDNNAQILINYQPISVVIDNLNFFAAENIKGVGGQDNHNDFEAYKDFVPGGANNDCLYLKNHTEGVQGDHVALNLKFIQRMVNDGFLPVYGKHLKLWVKVSDLTDGYYTDWIVSFMPSSYKPQSDKYIRHDEDTWHAIERGRVFCEDLGRAAREDLDYNDIVFDAIVFRKNTKHYETHEVWDKDPDKYADAQNLSSKTTEYADESVTFYLNIKLLAAGGTIPVSLKIGEEDENNPDAVKEYVVHDQFNDPEPTPTDMMVNTRDNNSTTYGSFGTRQPVQLGDIYKTFSVNYDDGTSESFDVQLIEVPESLARIDEIRLWSCFRGGTDVAEIQHVKGGAPQKFMAPWGTTKWASERNNISLAYPGNATTSSFNDWVEDRANVPWGYANTNYCYLEDQPYNPDGRQLPLAFRSYSNVSIEKETRLWESQGGHSFGSTWNLANLDLTLDVPQFFAGDRLRFYAKDIPTPNGKGDDAKFTSDEQKAWITVVVGDITPYFVNTEFPYYAVEKGERVFKTSGCLEVIIDQAAANMINNYIAQHGHLTFQVQGRNFTLTCISRVIE